MEKKPLIIFDTDMDTDCDDAGALAMVINEVKRGNAELIGIIASAPVCASAPCCEQICKTYGFSAPIGAVNEEKYRDTERFKRYLDLRASVKRDIYYNRAVSKQLNKTDKDYTPAAKLYRELLAKAEDKSITLVCVGFLTAVSELFETEADEISNLSGIELFEKKIKEFISMGNIRYPEYSGTIFNYTMDSIGTNSVFERSPTPIIISPMGTEIITGYSLPEHFEKDHPVRVAYKMFVGEEGRGRSSWDPVAVLYALGHKNLFDTQNYGTARFDKNGRGYWKEGERKDILITPNIPNEQAAEMIEKMIIS